MNRNGEDRKGECRSQRHHRFRLSHFFELYTLLQIHTSTHSTRLICYSYTEEKLHYLAFSTIALPSAVEFLRLQRFKFNVCAWLPAGVKQRDRFVSGSTSSALNSPWTSSLSFSQRQYPSVSLAHTQSTLCAPSSIQSRDFGSTLRTRLLLPPRSDTASSPPWSRSLSIRHKKNRTNIQHIDPQCRVRKERRTLPAQLLGRRRPATRSFRWGIAKGSING